MALEKACATQISSGKGAADENFPVGSFLLPSRLRPHVALYYDFARTIDDIADSSLLDSKSKIQYLNGFARALQGKEHKKLYGTAIALRQSLINTKVNPRHALDLISAFKQDAIKQRYANWDELMDYCERSASPVGRYLLELHGENTSSFVFSDALCNALQVINHLQDCKKDYINLNRVYLPQCWLKAHKASVSDLKRRSCTPGLRKTLQRCTTETRALMKIANRLPYVLRSRRLAMESSIIVRIANRLLDKLEREDPLTTRVVLGPLNFCICAVSGALAGLLGRR